MRFLCTLFILSTSAFAASPILFGGRGGATFSDNPSSFASGINGISPSKTYVIGPTVGVRLPLGFSVEGDALYNRQNLNFGQIGGFSAGTHADSWEFPVLMKFTAGQGMIAPVFGAGVSVRHINNFGTVPSFLFGSTDANTVGFVASAGFQFRAGAAHITPEFRYTRWQSNSLAQSIIDSFVPGRNAAQVLIGITF
jgi:hypothetical protein